MTAALRRLYRDHDVMESAIVGVEREREIPTRALTFRRRFDPVLVSLWSAHDALERAILAAESRRKRSGR